jgi:hypothetical protein
MMSGLRLDRRRTWKNVPLEHRNLHRVNPVSLSGWRSVALALGGAISYMASLVTIGPSHRLVLYDRSLGHRRRRAPTPNLGGATLEASVETS